MTIPDIFNCKILVLAALASLAPLSCAKQTKVTHSDTWNPPAVSLKQAPKLQDALIGFDDRRAIFVGEIHTRYDHHLVQLEVLKFLHRRHIDVAVGVEWFQFPFQKHLDDYFAGRSTEAEMLERTEYFERWRYDYRLYRPIMEYAKANNLPLIALNAPREITRQIGAGGISSLTDDLKARLPANYDRSNQDYVTRIQHQFEQHPGDDRNFENFLEVMLTWDETMADQAAKHLQAHPRRRMIIFAGSGHVAFGTGIPKRLERRIGVPSATILVGLDGITEPTAADYAVLSKAQSLPPSGLLGAFLESSESGVTIVGLSEDSALKDAGVAKDDIILAIDDQEVSTFAAVKLALLDRKPGETVAVRYLHSTWLGKQREKTADVKLRGRRAPNRP